MSNGWNAYWCRFFASDGRPVASVYNRKNHESRVFVTGARAALDDNIEVPVCALIHAADPDVAWREIRRCFPEAACDSLDPKPMDWRPGDRFPGLVPLTVSP